MSTSEFEEWDRVQRRKQEWQQPKKGTMLMREKTGRQMRNLKEKTEPPKPMIAIQTRGSVHIRVA